MIALGALMLVTGCFIAELNPAIAAVFAIGGIYIIYKSSDPSDG